MLIRTLLIDDEKSARKTLRSLIREFSTDLEIIGEADSVSSGMKAILQDMPELIFLDMELKGKYGLELLEKLDPRDHEVIITTAHDQFALPSFEFGVVDYLLKPITPSQFKRAVSRVKERILMKRLALEEEKDNPMLTVTTLEGTRLIAIKKIVRLEANRNYTWLHVRYEKPVLISRSLAYFEEALIQAGFLRVHHSHIINPSSIRGLQKNGNELVLEDQSQIPVSREKKKIIATFIHP